MRDEDKQMERFNQKVFIKNGVTFLPHYSKKDIFVAPGYKGRTPDSTGRMIPVLNEYTKTELVLLGAKESSMFLWSRV